MLELKSGDLCIAGSRQFSDYRRQLVSEEEYQHGIALYGQQAGIPVESQAFIDQLGSVSVLDTILSKPSCFQTSGCGSIAKSETLPMSFDQNPYHYPKRQHHAYQCQQRVTPVSGITS